MEDIRRIIVPGRPQAKQRARVGHNGAFTPKQTKLYEAKIKRTYLDAYGDAPLMEGDLTVGIAVYFQKRNHGDLDNYIKTLDALNKVAWNDDKQIKHIDADLFVNKKEPERMEISVMPLQNQFYHQKQQ